MDIDEKRQFISELIDTVHNKVLANVDKMPKEWDGIELRQYLADKFAENTMWRLTPRERKREYENTMIVSNL